MNEIPVCTFWLCKGLLRISHVSVTHNLDKPKTRYTISYQYYVFRTLKINHYRRFVLLALNVFLFLTISKILIFRKQPIMESGRDRLLLKKL